MAFQRWVFGPNSIFHPSIKKIVKTYDLIRLYTIFFFSSIYSYLKQLFIRIVRFGTHYCSYGQ